MSSPTERIAGFLRMSGLESLAGREGDVGRAVRDFVETLGEKVVVEDLEGLYTYPVPMMTEDGACSIVDRLAPMRYDLGPILGGRSEQTTRRLALLKRLAQRAQETTGADWVGIYQRRSNTLGIPVLVKVAYVGRASRAEFPLTPEFAERSTNSTVGLTARSAVIDDVAKHVEAGGGFYVCDDGVQSEACVPILSGNGEVAGIVDAEAKPRGFFGADRLAVIAALALVAAPVLP
ncbi:MAG TPA: GAF domain-containing protein [Usitatibacter sp.]|nr:GAF domain-containing protein [Usitatibacter sp.]